MVLPCSDGYTVYLDEKDSSSGMMRHYQHALDHIKRADWQKEDVQEIEAIAHGLKVEVTDESNARIEELLARLRERHKTVERKLKQYEEKYKNMSPYEILMHNEKVIRGETP